MRNAAKQIASLRGGCVVQKVQRRGDNFYGAIFDDGTLRSTSLGGSVLHIKRLSRGVADLAARL